MVSVVKRKKALRHIVEEWPMEVTDISPLAVGGYRYTVTTPTEYLRDLDLWAQHDTETMQIKVRDYFLPQKMSVSLLHEVIHAILTTFHGGEQMPESLVESLANGFYQVIIDNPKLIQYIAESRS